MLIPISNTHQGRNKMTDMKARRDQLEDEELMLYEMYYDPDFDCEFDLEEAYFSKRKERETLDAIIEYQNKYTGKK